MNCNCPKYMLETWHCPTFRAVYEGSDARFFRNVLARFIDVILFCM